MLLLTALLGCGSRHPGFTDAAIDAGYIPDACEGLTCFQFDCSTKGLLPTRVSGTVYAPNGTLPLYGVNVYVPRVDPGPLPSGVQCDRCDQGLLGGSLAQTKTDEAGRFVLEDVPATANVPIVIQVGKWRRQIVLPNVAACEELPLSTADTRLPKDRTEGDLPHIAISTGAADALECLMLKLGIAPTEITGGSGTGAVHLFTNTGIAPPTTAPPASGRGTDQFAPGFAGGSGMFSDSRALWGSLASLSSYDIVIWSCEGGQHPTTKPQAALDALKDYADLGGRVFLSHWHNVWIQTQTAWAGTSTWNNSGTTFNANDTIDEINNPKGVSFADWMLNVGGSTTRALVPVVDGKQTCTGVDSAKAERWVYWLSAGTEYPQNFLFTTPNEKPPEERCGKVVFSDMHVSNGSLSSSGTTYAYPNGCSALPLSPQEKALAFIFFDISSCVGTIF